MLLLPVAAGVSRISFSIMVESWSIICNFFLLPGQTFAKIRIFHLGQIKLLLFLLCTLVSFVLKKSQFYPHCTTCYFSPKQILSLVIGWTGKNVEIKIVLVKNNTSCIRIILYYLHFRAQITSPVCTNCVQVVVVLR